MSLDWNRLALPEESGSYRWWYVDATSDDGRESLVVIFFWGSVFSPSYAARLRRGEQPHPAEHAAVHAVRYVDGRPAMWLLAERPEASLEGSAYRVGESAISFERQALTAEISDWGPRRTRGTLRLSAEQPPLNERPVQLAPGLGQTEHLWWPAMPRARIAVRFEEPEPFAWQGFAYHDSNWGNEPMERALRGWRWQQQPTPSGVGVDYDVIARSGDRFIHRFRPGHEADLAQLSDSGSGLAALGLPRRTAWGIALPDGARTLDSAPFYARYLAPHGGVGETLDLDRFSNPVVRWMLRWKTWRHESPLARPSRSLLGAGW